MNDEDRKYLTEKMGETWHDTDRCPHCGYHCTGNTVYCTPPIPYRTFTTWTDFGAVWEFKEKADWGDEFHNWYDNKCWDEVLNNDDPDYRITADRLVNPLRFPQLVCDFLREVKP